MKKFKSTLPQGTGLKFFDKYLETELSAEIWDAMQSLVAGIGDLTEGFILTGGTVTGVAPTAQIIESIVVLNGKLLRLPATTGLSYPFYIEEAATVEINAEYNDLVPRAAIDEEAAQTATSAPVSGQYITVSAAGEYKKSLPARAIAEENGEVLKTKIIQIGDWDMDATASVTVAHGLTDIDKVRIVDVQIRKDDDAGSIFNKPLNSQLVTGTAGNDGSFTYDATDFTLARKTSGSFDGVDYDKTSFNRGWITILYAE